MSHRQRTCVMSAGSVRCFCEPGYEGEWCGEETDECLSNPCFNGASCTDALNGYTCNCRPGEITMFSLMFLVCLQYMNKQLFVVVTGELHELLFWGRIHKSGITMMGL